MDGGPRGEWLEGFHSRTAGQEQPKNKFQETVQETAKLKKQYRVTNLEYQQQKTVPLAFLAPGRAGFVQGAQSKRRRP